jgi:hypothetical protein
MIRRFPAVLVAFVCLGSLASAQSPSPISVAGIVIDHRTEQPVPGVLVDVEDQAQVATSDADGRFALTLPPGRYVIGASVIGYALLRAEITVAAGAIVPVTFRMSEGAGSYTDRVTVSGTRRTDAGAGPGSGALFGRELENLRGVMLDDPLRAIQAMPSATATDDFYSEFAVRGSSWRHVGLAIDGMPTKYLMHTVHGVVDGGSIAMINSETLGSVALHPGSYPQRTGRHLGAQVDLATREGNRETFRGRAGLSGTSATFMADGPLADGRGSWLVSARRSYLDYLIKRIDPDASFAFGFYDGQAKVVYDLSPAHQVSFTSLLGRAAFNEDEENLDDNDRQQSTSHAWLHAAGWRYTPGPRFVLTQRLYTTGVTYDTRNPFGTTIDSASSLDVGWRADASFAPGDRWLVEFGGDAQRLTGESFFSRRLTATGPQVTLSAFDERTSAASMYAQARVALGSRLTVTPGVRADRWSLQDATTASPWLTAELALGGRTRLRGGSGAYRQFADLDQVHGLRGGGTGLRPERAVHVDLGVEHSLRDDTRVTVTAYTRSERDVLWPIGSEPHRLPDGRIAAGFADAPWVNAWRGRARGFEALVRRDAPAGLSGWLGYAYGRHRYTQAATAETFPANADQRHTLSAYGTYRLSARTGVSAKFRYGSNYPLLGYLAQPADAPIVDGRPAYYTVAAVRNGERLPPYARLDVRGDRAFNWSGRRLVLFVEVANVLNRENRRNVPFGIDRSGRVFNPTETLMPIVPSAGFVVEF